MIRAYKHFRKKLTFVKHESKISQVSELYPIQDNFLYLELTEDSGQDPIVEGVTFYVRYLGSCFVINKAGDETTSEAIKSIVSMVSGIDIVNSSIAASNVR